MANFEVDVGGIGKFTFAKRRFRDQFRIEALATQLLGGPCDDDRLRAGALAFATLSVLTVSHPEGWDLEALDPYDPADSAAQLFKVHGALRDAEDRFRGQPAKDGARPGLAA